MPILLDRPLPPIRPESVRRLADQGNAICAYLVKAPRLPRTVRELVDAIALAAQEGMGLWDHCAGTATLFGAEGSKIQSSFRDIIGYAISAGTERRALRWLSEPPDESEGLVLVGYRAGRFKMTGDALLGFEIADEDARNLQLRFPGRSEAAAEAFRQLLPAGARVTRAEFVVAVVEVVFERMTFGDPRPLLARMASSGTGEWGRDGLDHTEEAKDLAQFAVSGAASMHGREARIDLEIAKLAGLEAAAAPPHSI